ncbi:MAG: chorismate synthase [Tidjanibacter sp.]|nr:chorismate synthase [Tidjanibacter sp.]
MNSFGHNFRLTIFGESHGPVIGVVIDGVPAGIPLCISDFECDLARRRSGTAGTTPRTESDTPEIVSGLLDGHTTGAPLAILFRNENTRSSDYSQFRTQPRPGHADRVAEVKFGGHNDLRGGGHFSGRLTLALVAAGVVAKKVIAPNEGCGPHPKATIVELGGSTVGAEWPAIIATAGAESDSVGGIIECRTEGMPTGIGEPFFDSLESVIAHLAFAIPGVRGVEFGDGFGSARMRGSEHNDLIINAEGTTATNGAGGINGGISNGNPLVFRLAVKPTSSIAREQQTYNFATGQVESLRIGGRHDVCIALRAAVVVEAIAAIALAELMGERELKMEN